MKSKRPCWLRKMLAITAKLCALPSRRASCTSPSVTVRPSLSHSLSITDFWTNCCQTCSRICSICSSLRLASWPCICICSLVMSLCSSTICWKSWMESLLPHTMPTLFLSMPSKIPKARTNSSAMKAKRAKPNTPTSSAPLLRIVCNAAI